MARPPLALGALFASLGALACASSGPSCPAASPLVEVAPPASPDAAVASAPASSAAPAASAPARSGRCWARGRPQEKALAPRAKGYCDAFDEAEIKRVEARIRHDFEIFEKPSRLIVDFGCDTAPNAVREVLFEDGGGHGGSLRLVRLQRQSDRVVGRMISRQQYFGKNTSVLAADLDRQALDRAIAQARVAMLARPHLIRLQVPNGIGSMGFSSSSHDFHIRIAITDEKDNVLDHRFTGYASSSEQEHSLPMRIAAEPLQKLIAAAAFKEVPATDDDRAYFTERFLLTMAEGPEWWVKERYVALAAQLGTADALPVLARLATTQGDASIERTRASALEAIASISGWDPRVDDSGAPRPEADAARLAAAECTP